MQKNAGDCREQPQNARTNPVQALPAGSVDVPLENENPGALAGATGADVRSYLERLDNTLNRVDATSAFSYAVAELHPEDRIPVLEAAFDFLRPGTPLPAFNSLMAEAYWWADRASRAERKAYAFACYQRMSEADQRSFIAHVTGARHDG
ncbi:MAG: hypothetical protein ACK5IP_14475 [Paracoccus sp. (in: a-proteobacteria)]